MLVCGFCPILCKLIMRFNCRRAEHIRTHAPDAKLIIYTYKEPIGFVLNHWDLSAEMQAGQATSLSGFWKHRESFF